MLVFHDPHLMYRYHLISSMYYHDTINVVDVIDIIDIVHCTQTVTINTVANNMHLSYIL